jgi:hypothetical protein
MKNLTLYFIKNREEGVRVDLKNWHYFVIFVFSLVISLFVFLSPNDILAVDDHGLQIQGHISIAPASIPVGTVGVGMTRLQFRSGDNDDTTSISKIKISLNGSIDSSNITAVNVYFEDEGGNATFDNGTVDEVDAIDGGGPVNIDDALSEGINIDYSRVEFGWGASKYLYVVFNFSASADHTKTVGCEITEVTYGAWGSGVGGTGSPKTPTKHNTTVNVDDYEVTLSASGIAPADAEQGEENVGILKLVFTAIDTSVTANIDSIRLHRVGSGTDADVAAAGIILYDDSGTIPGSFDSGDQQVLGGSGSLSGGYVTLNPTANLEVTSSGATYYVAINIAATATVGKTIGLEVANPASDIVFLDVETDPYVSTQYNQKGYITSSSSTPGSGNTVTILERPGVDLTPPTISYTNPASDERNVPITRNIVAVFSESIDVSTVNTSTFTLKDSRNNSVAGTVTASGQTATFNPASDLSYETMYTATITTGVKDLAGNAMEADYTWSFTTMEEVPEPVAANNRIKPGSKDPVKIYIPAPPGGAQERVTVEVYTVTGERVVTLVNNRPYQEIVSSLPLEWYGKNGKQKDLGPGLYFIQIRTKSYKKVLKVLIVR